ncbi:hypothetical protein [Synechococcus sp. CCY 0621]|uniref:hypothetical protein n=1 Tax=Synechococcus sp. CCY 0621 TaxID=2815603 RepID=UPI001C210A2F|nr:hypothetical protein [Synechococcus sp. CCY 0621]
MQELAPDEAWTHALKGLLAEVSGVDGYSDFAEALQRDACNYWFRYWTSVAALRRRNWIGFAHLALPLADSDIMEHQVSALAAVHHFAAASLELLMPDLCHANALRASDLLHPDMIPHDLGDVVHYVHRNINKERRKMIRILITSLRESHECSSCQCTPHLTIKELLKWRIKGFQDPPISAGLYGSLQQQLQSLPAERLGDIPLEKILPQHQDSIIDDTYHRVLRDFRLTLIAAS